MPGPIGGSIQQLQASRAFGSSIVIWNTTQGDSVQFRKFCSQPAAPKDKFVLAC